MAREPEVAYRITRWIDTSPASMEQEAATINYGVQVKLPALPWMHMHEGVEPCIFEDIEEAEMFIGFMRRSDRDQRAEIRAWQAWVATTPPAKVVAFDEHV